MSAYKNSVCHIVVAAEPWSAQDTTDGFSITGTLDAQFFLVRSSKVVDKALTSFNSGFGWYAGNPSSDSTFGNLPLGFVIFDTSTPAVWLKLAAKGTNTWKSVTLT